MTADREQPQVDTSPSEHERRVLEERGARGADEPTDDPGRRPTSNEDLAADRAIDLEEDEAK